MARRTPNADRIILDLCGGTGSWSEPYRTAGYDVRLVTLPDHDVRTYVPPDNVWGVLAAPPCTHFSVSGARWWKDKNHLLSAALSLVHGCQRIIRRSRCRWWALENPVGRLPRYIGPYVYTFQPFDYGDPWTKRTCIWGEHHQPEKSPVRLRDVKLPAYKSRGGHYKGRDTVMTRVRNSRHNNPAAFISALAREGKLSPDWIHRLGPSPQRATLRSITPPGFARAFFEANP